MSADKFTITKRRPGLIEIMQLHPAELGQDISTENRITANGLNEAAIIGLALIATDSEKEAFQWI